MLTGIWTRAGLVVAMVATLLGGSVAVPTPAEATVTSLEYQLARYHNSARTSRGLRALVVDSSLSDKARAHTRGMIKVGKLFHTSSLSRRYGTGEGPWRRLGENVGYASTIADVHRAFMASSGHRANILHSGYRRFGLGIVRSGSRYWVTVAFIG
jgi:uncharacterized protein YkwD